MSRAFRIVSAGLALGWALAPATANAAAHASPAAPTPMPAESGPDLSGFVAAGGSLRWLYDVPIRGLEVAAGLGPADAAARTFNAYVVPRFFFGSTRAGLGVQQLTLGARAEWRFGGFAYAGGTVAAGILWLERAREGSMTNATGSASLFIGPELRLSDSVAAGLNLTGSAEYAPGTDDTVLLGTGLELRVRFF